MSEQVVIKKKKSKGPIRFEAIIPTLIIIAAIYIYFHFFFDGMLRRSIEWVGYQTLGAEVDVAQLETSFWKASIEIKGVELTDSENPTHNFLEIGSMRFSMLWDALLRAKIVINESSIEQIAINTLRKHPGKVKPPEPPKPDAGPSLLEKEGQKIADQALDKVQTQNESNALGDIAAVLGGTDFNAQLKNIEGTLPSKQLAEALEKNLKQKQVEWDAKLKTLPNEAEVKALTDRLSRVKLKDFKTPQELQNSLREIDTILKEADQKFKTVQSAHETLTADLQNIEAQYKALEKQFQIDVKSLESRFRIPSLKAGDIAKSIFMSYVTPYLNKFQKYKNLAHQYLPPNLTSKDKKEDIQIQPRPRAKGVSYEFGRPNGYPFFWLKKAVISSSSKGDPSVGDVRGELTNVTSNQIIIQKPTVLNVVGDFNAQQVTGVKLNATMDHRSDEKKESFSAEVGSYPIDGKELVQSPDVKIAFAKANGSLDLKGQFDNEGIGFNLQNRFTQIAYDVNATNEIADSMLKEIFKGIPVVTLEAKGQGHFPRIPLSINSNLGEELRKGFEKQIQAKINEARAKIKKYIDDMVGAQKARIESEINKTKAQVDREIAKVTAELNAQKAKAEGQANQAKKDAENQVKNQAEDELKKKADELKKKLGF